MSNVVTVVAVVSTIAVAVTVAVAVVFARTMVSVSGSNAEKSCGELEHFDLVFSLINPKNRELLKGQFTSNQLYINEVL